MKVASALFDIYQFLVSEVGSRGAVTGAVVTRNVAGYRVNFQVNKVTYLTETKSCPLLGERNYVYEKAVICILFCSMPSQHFPIPIGYKF